MKMKKSPIAGLFAAVLIAGTLVGCTSPGNGAEKAPAQKASAPVKPGDTLHDRLAGKKWLLAGYDAGSLFVPLEPGHGSTAWILLHLVRELGQVRRLKTGKDSILLADAQDKTLLQFIYRGESSLF